MNNTYIVYKHTNLVNNKIYIGLTIHGDNPNLRWQGGSGYSTNKEFYDDIEFYGWQNFSHEILEKNLTNVEAFALERYYIDLYDSTNPEKGYNKSSGYNQPSADGRMKISNALTGIKRSAETIQKQMNTKQERYGTGRSIKYAGYTHKVKCIETNDVFVSIEDAKRWAGTTKIQECCDGKRAHAGRHPETNILLSWRYAEPDEEITIICEEEQHIRKKIQKIECVETGEVFDNASHANRKTGVATCNILRVCQKKRQTAGGKHWRYVEE